ncbi:ABC transporter ATP-binding protein [Trueperella pyogenes]|uniref:ABC transporter ATP-binding protein n=1 Tax=Trueperella pyogenes TaxID=1661 RepID=UPI00345C832E
MSVVQLDSVSFWYGRDRIIQDMDLVLERGITGLLGPNGAGKTTLIRLLALDMRPKCGSVIINGTPVNNETQARKCRRHIGYLPQRFEVMNFKTVQDNVEFAAWAHGVSAAACNKAAADALEKVGLADRAKSRAFSLSGGMRQRLGLACVIVHKPEILILDEPTVGIDPVQRSQMRQLLRELAANSAILLSTHLVDDVAHICDRVLIVNHGTVKFDGSISALEELGSDRAHRDMNGSAAENGYLEIMDNYAS